MRPSTAPSLLHNDESYTGINHDMGTALTNEGHSNSAVDTGGSAHGTADSGRTETDWSCNVTSGGTSNPDTGGETKIATMAFAKNHSPCPDNSSDRGSGSAAAYSTGAGNTDNKHSHTAAGAAENGAPHGTCHEVRVMPKEGVTGTGGAPATAKGHETDIGMVQHVAQDIGSA